MIAPYEGRFKVSQVYKGQDHKGIDLVGLDSKEIHSTINGIVEAARWDNADRPSYGMGKYIRIKEDVTGYRYYFAHLSKSCIKVGQHVLKGQKIGVEGSTGHSTGSHLHYEVRQVPDNRTYRDISQIGGIPNVLGVYSADIEVLDMTQKELEQLIDQRAKAVVKEVLYGDGSIPSKWAKDSWAKSTVEGIIDGSRPKGYVTREEMSQALQNAKSRG